MLHRFDYDKLSRDEYGDIKTESHAGETLSRVLGRTLKGRNERLMTLQHVLGRTQKGPWEGECVEVAEDV